MIQFFILPFYMLMWFGIRNERIKQERLLHEAVRSLKVVSISRGRRNF